MCLCVLFFNSWNTSFFVEVFLQMSLSTEAKCSLTVAKTAEKVVFEEKLKVD